MATREIPRAFHCHHSAMFTRWPETPSVRQLAFHSCVDRGIARIEWDAEMPLDALIDELGATAVEHRVLTPRPADEARSHTLSSLYGLGTLPWHTDGAHWPVPPRASLMRASAGSSTPTYFLDAREVIQSADLEARLRQGSWCVIGSRTPFYVAAVASDGAVRFNADVMRPAGSRAAEAQAQLVRALGSAAFKTHQWSAGEALLIDNHRVLHSRPPVPETDRDRRLERILCRAPTSLGC